MTRLEWVEAAKASLKSVEDAGETWPELERLIHEAELFQTDAQWEEGFLREGGKYKCRDSDIPD